MARVSMHSGAPVAIDPYDTNEKKIAELRKCREAKLYVRPDFIDAFIEEFDKEHAAVLHLGASTAALLARAEAAEAESRLRLEAVAKLQEAYDNERAKVAELTPTGLMGD